jgi:hypothetical protein
VIGGDANTKILDVLSKEFGLDRAKVFKDIALPDARTAIQSKDVNALSPKMTGRSWRVNDLWISLAVFAVIFGGALVGVFVRPLLSEKHLHPDSRDVVKMATGLIGTLAALVLGLLIASAKSSFDQKTSQVRQMTATIILLDDLLARYGPEAASVRNLLRQSIPPLANRIWREDEIAASKPDRFEASAQSLAFENQLERLSPHNDTQRSLQSRAVQAFTAGAQI